MERYSRGFFDNPTRPATMGAKDYSYQARISYVFVVG